MRWLLLQQFSLVILLNDSCSIALGDSSAIGIHPIEEHLHIGGLTSGPLFAELCIKYNTGIQQMPAALFAGPFGFTRKEFYDLGASRTEVEAVPTVKF